MRKARQGAVPIWNMCFGFFGIQVGLGLQNADLSRIFQTLGADSNRLAFLWIAAPLTGVLVQPIVGYLSDKTWGPLGRRRPYLLIGAVVSAAALWLMPNAPTVWVAVAALWVLDAAINFALQPLRAFIGDLLPESQRATGFALQSVFIGLGAVLASALPWILSHGLGLANHAPAGVTPASVKVAFYIGGVCLLASVLWTVFSVKEPPPEQMAAFALTEAAEQPQPPAPRGAGFFFTVGAGCLIVAAAIAVGARLAQLNAEVLVLAELVAGLGALLGAVALFKGLGRPPNGLTEVVDDIVAMPRTMRMMAVVQFFSWFGLFAMWIYTTAAVTSFHYGAHDTRSPAYNEGADWVGVLFAIYNGVAAVFAFGLPALAARIGRKQTHALALACGGIGLAAFILIRTPGLLWIPMIGVGIAWASILSMPYAILSSATPTLKMGVYMGVFNIFIVLPQVVAATLLGVILKVLFADQTIYALVFGGACMGLSALLALAVPDPHDPIRARRSGQDAPRR